MKNVISGQRLGKPHLKWQGSDRCTSRLAVQPVLGHLHRKRSIRSLAKLLRLLSATKFFRQEREPHRASKLRIRRLYLEVATLELGLPKCMSETTLVLKCCDL